MSTWFKVGGYSKDPIETLNVVKETTHQLVYIDNNGNENRINKAAGHICFDAYDKAKQYLIEEKQKEITRLQGKLSRCIKDLENINLL